MFWSLKTLATLVNYTCKSFMKLTSSVELVQELRDDLDEKIPSSSSTSRSIRLLSCNLSSCSTSELVGTCTEKLRQSKGP